MEKKYSSKDIINILERVVIHHQLHLTKDGKIYSPDAEEIIEWLNCYKQYCLPFRSDAWENSIRELLYHPKVLKPWVVITEDLKKYLDDDKRCIMLALYHYMDAAEVMDTYATTKSWEEVEKTIENQGHSSHTFACMRDILLDYSLMGVEFIERFDPDSLEKCKERKKAYLERKNYLEQVEKCINILNEECKRQSK